MKFKAAVVFGAAMTISAQARAEPPPLTAYAADPAISALDVSPDGSKVAFLRTDGGDKRAILLPAADQAPVELSLGKLRVTGLSWLDADHLMIIHSAMLKGGDIMPRQVVSQGLSYNVLTTHTAILLQDTAMVPPMLTGGVPMIRGHLNGKPVLFLRALEPSRDTTVQFSLYAADVESGRGQEIDPGSLDAESWVVTPEGQRVARTAYDPSTRSWSLSAWLGSGWNVVQHQRTDVRPYVIGLGRAPGTVAAQQDDDLYQISLADGSRGPSLTPPGLTVMHVLIQGATNRLAGARLSGDTPSYIFFDPAWRAAWDKASRTFPGKRVALAAHDDSFGQVVVEVEGPGQPGSYYWVHLNDNRAELIGDQRPLINPDQVGPVSKVDYAAADGLKLGGYLTLPPGREPKRLPLVVLVHDGPHGRDTLTFDPQAQALASRGYAVLQVNYRGSSGVATGFQDAGNGEWGRKMQTDLSDGVAHLATQGTIDPKRVCIMGSGFGGYSALAGVTLQHGIYRCAIAINAISDVPAAIKLPESYSRGPAWDRVVGWRKDLGSDHGAAEAVSPLAHAAQADAPILLMHGTDDQIVPISQSEAMRRSLSAAKRRVQLVTLAGGEHDLQTEALRRQALEAALDFLQANNPAVAISPN